MKVVKVSSNPLTATMSLNGIDPQRCAEQVVGILTDLELPGAAFTFCDGFEGRFVLCDQHVQLITNDVRTDHHQVHRLRMFRRLDYGSHAVLQNIVQLITKARNRVFQQGFALALGQLKNRRYLRFGRQCLPEVALNQIQQAVLFRFIGPTRHAAFYQHFQVFGQARLGDSLQGVGDFVVGDPQGLFDRLPLLEVEYLGVNRERDLHGSDPRDYLEGLFGYGSATASPWPVRIFQPLSTWVLGLKSGHGGSEVFD